MPDHTQLPWKMHKGQYGTFYITGVGDNSNIAVVQTFEPNQVMKALVGAKHPIADAMLLVRAVNLHKTLLALIDKAEPHLPLNLQDEIRAARKLANWNRFENRGRPPKGSEEKL